MASRVQDDTVSRIRAVYIVVEAFNLTILGRDLMMSDIPVRVCS